MCPLILTEHAFKKWIEGNMLHCTKRHTQKKKQLRLLSWAVFCPEVMKTGLVCIFSLFFIFMSSQWQRKGNEKCLHHSSISTYILHLPFALCLSLLMNADLLSSSPSWDHIKKSFSLLIKWQIDQSDKWNYGNQCLSKVKDWDFLI